MKKTEFEKYLELYYPDFLRFARNLAGSDMDGDDLLQDALIKGYCAFSKLKDKQQYKYWMLKIISNTFKSKMRRRWLRNLFSLDQVISLPVEESLSYEDKDLVRLALKSVPLQQRETLILYEIVGMSIKEIGEMHEVSQSAVKSRLVRGRERLRTNYLTLTRLEEKDVERITQTG